MKIEIIKHTMIRRAFLKVELYILAGVHANVKDGNITRKAISLNFNTNEKQSLRN